MAGRGRGRANTLPAWMTKQGLNAPPPAGPAPGSRPPPCAGAGPPPLPHNGQFDDAPEPVPRPSLVRKDVDEYSGGKRRSRSRDHGNERRNGGDFRGPPPLRERSRSRSRGSGRHRDRDYAVDRRRDDSYRRGPPSRGRSLSRSRERREHRGDSRRGGGDRYEDRGYAVRGPRDADYRRYDGRPLRRDDEAVERGYRRPSSNGHDDRTFRRYAADYQP